MDVPPEVLIYVQSIKNFFESNEEARNYFMTDIDEETYFATLTDVAIKNLEKKGVPELSKLQFEFLRMTLKIYKTVEEEIKNSSIIYEYTPTNIKFYLN